MDRDQPTVSFLGRLVPELDHWADLAARIENHVPGQAGDLAGAQPRFYREEENYLIAFGV